MFRLFIYFAASNYLMDIDPLINAVYPIPAESREALKQHITEISFPKGHIIIRADKVEKHIYMIKRGMLRAYSDTEANQLTFWFGKEGDIAISMNSHVSDKKGYENIELIEDCDLYVIHSDALKSLYNTDIHIANWGRRFAEQELLKTEERLISRQFGTATERYRELALQSPHLMQRVALGHIASYLGITQASLSRIRADVK